MIGKAKRPKLSVDKTPTVIERVRCRLCARELGRNPSSCAAAITRSRVSVFSLPLSLSALDAVPIDTPARSATSRIVARSG
ncbi:hypothetical protein D3C87_2081070 [compost metagenome]